jgi:hypothetical protein
MKKFYHLVKQLFWQAIVQVLKMEYNNYQESKLNPTKYGVVMPVVTDYY